MAVLINLYCLAVPCRLSRRAWFVTIVALLVCFSKNIAYRVLGGDQYWPDLPRWLVIGWDILAGGLLLTVPMAIVSRVAFSFMAIHYRRIVALMVVVIAWAMSLVGVLAIQSEPRLVEVTAEYDNLPHELDGMRIVQLTDLHVCATTAPDLIAKLVSRVNGLDPDIVVLTGDYCDGWSSRKWAMLEPLRGLKAHDGVFAVTGNHEYYFGYFPLPEKFREWGIVLLENNCVSIRNGAAVIGGIHHEQIGGYSEYGEFPDVRKTFRKAPKNAFRILLVHAAKYARLYAEEHNVGLQISGHTHGGITPLVYCVTKVINNGFVRGMYDLGGRLVYVSAGIGEWGKLPVRLFDPPELTLITLRCK